MGVSRADGDPRVPVTDIPLCSHSRDVGKGKKPPTWIKRSGEQKVSQQVDHGKGTSKIKWTKCSKTQKINWDGKCLKLVKRGLSLNLNIPSDSSLK